MAYTKIPGNLIESGAITAAALDNDAVTTAKILDANITHAKLHTSMDLTGKTVTVATAAGSTNTTAAASTAFVQQELTTLIGGAPGTLDTLNELAAAINDDSNYNSTLTTALATKLPLAGGTMTGALTSNSLIKTTADLEVASAQPRIILDRGDGAYTWNIYNGNGSGNFPNSTFNIANNGGDAVLTALDNGNVGIGTTNPGTPLTISNLDNGTSFSSNRVLQLIGTSTTDGSRVSLAFSGNTNIGNGLAIIEAVNDDQSAGHTSLHMHTYNGSWNTENLVLKGGKVGIGTDSPATQLQVKSSSYPYVRITNNGYTGFDIGQADASEGGAALVKLRDAADMDFYTADLNRMRISSTGNVGIGTGTNDPVSKLHLGGTAPGDSIIRQDSTSSGTNWEIGERVAGKYQFWEDDGDKVIMTLMSAGNVGIGTESPSAPLSLLNPSLTTNGTGEGGLRVHRPNAASQYGYFDYGYNGGGVNIGSLYSGGGASAFGTFEFRQHSQTTYQIPMFIDSVGKVGIGTTSPSKSLSVKAPSGSNGGIDVFHNNGNKVAELVHHGSGDEGRLSLYDGGANTVQIHGETGQPSYINSGNVGINTTVPSNKLSIKGRGNNWNTSPAIKLWDSQYSKGWYVGTANNEAPGDFYIRSVTSEGAYPVAGNEQFTLKHDGSLCLGTLDSDGSASMGGQTPKLTVDGYTSLGGLRIKGSDGGNTIYRNGGSVSVVSANHSVDIKGTTVNLVAGGHQIFRAATNRWSLGGGTYGHGRVRSYHYHASLSAGQTVALLQNQSAHTDVNFIYWIEAFHSSRSYRTGMGTFGGYGMNKSSASNGGLDIYGTNVSSGIQRLDIQAHSTFATAYHISMIIFGDSGITVHNGTMSDQIA